ncbi:MAG TPA: type I-C CRISPR-associated protein Cas5, partial [Thiotrichales bacterium]|nr:type I-C CRISPR-associated protein Cas5 [Thiotrichales bacterium]
MKTHSLEVSGDFACFTRPEMKVERVSYDVITPSAARAIFDAILWKPAIRWHVERIEVLKPIRWINLRRNEVGGVIPMGSVKTAMKRGSGQLALQVEDDRQQRAGLFLRDVAYRLHARFEILDHGDGNAAVKFSEMFERRLRKGQCFNQPYLGCREFSADFRSLPPEAERIPPIGESRDLGWMLYDLDYGNPDDPTPRFFQARMEN